MTTMASELFAKVLAQLPELRPSTNIRLVDGDTIIHAPGFEDRTMGFAVGLTADPHARAVLLDYRPLNPNNRVLDVRKAMSNSGLTVFDDDLITYDRFI